MKKIEFDAIRYKSKKAMPKFQIYMRKYQDTNNNILKLLYKVLFVIYRNRLHNEMSINSHIGSGLYFGHPFCININPESVIGMNCNIHKGVTIGQENRGKRKGAPKIGNEVWIGVNATIVGNVKIGNDVLIAPNTYINCDIPDHSIVVGNPCVIYSSEHATEGYINNKVSI